MSVVELLSVELLNSWSEDQSVVCKTEMVSEQRKIFNAPAEELVEITAVGRQLHKQRSSWAAATRREFQVHCGAIISGQSTVGRQEQWWKLELFQC